MSADDLELQFRAAIRYFWRRREMQAKRQAKASNRDAGSRGAVTGGAQLDKVVELFANIAVRVGVPKECVFRRTSVELPGFFRPTKEWDLVIVKKVFEKYHFASGARR